MFLTACILPLTAFSQKKADRKVLASLQQHISSLSVDSTRFPDSLKMWQDITYLENQFHAAGILPVNGTYRQTVIYDEGKKFIPGASLSLNDKSLQPGKDFIPLSYSAQANAKGEPLIAVQERGQPWILDINNYIGNEQETGLNATLYKLAEQAVHDKASAVIFYNSAGAAKDLTFNPGETFIPLPVPVIYINNATAKSYFSDPMASIGVKLSVAFSEKKDTTYNVIGHINNNAGETILIGASDAGDQAALIELGRLLKSDKHFSKENYLLVSFAGKKYNTSGVNYFLEHPPIDLSSLHCFINLQSTDSVIASPDLWVTGNLSPEWETILKKIRRKNISVREDTTANYFPEISSPVLSLASHASGHFNAEGELNVVKYLADVIREINRTAK